MFEGKIVYYQNNNGHVEKVEKTFDNYDEYQKFLREHDDVITRHGFTHYDRPQRRAFAPLRGGFSLGDWREFQRYLNDVVGDNVRQKLGGSCAEDGSCDEELTLDKYEQAKQKIEYEKQHQEERKKKLEKKIEKLKEYKKLFTKEGKDDLLKDVEKDLKDAEAKLKKLTA